MAEELRIISPNLLTNVSEIEVNTLIEQMIEKSKTNKEEICELTLECTTLLSSAESRTVALGNQGVFKRLICGITQKNRKLHNAILQDNINALYIAQGVINRVMLECVSNRMLFLAVNDRISSLYYELKENQNDISEVVLKTRQAIVGFFKKYQGEILAQEKRISQMEEYAKNRCPKCQNEMQSWQRVCSCCGYIHPLKICGASEETKRILTQISEVVKDEMLSEDIVWDITAKKIESILRKVRTLAQIGRLPGYTDKLNADIDNLINKCKYAEFQIAVVGVMKAGKSFLMNALIGAEIASVGVNPETAALTKFRSANGYYVIVKFYDKTQWDSLKESAKNSKKTGKDSLVARLANPLTERMESEWVGHDDLKIECKTLKDLKDTVKKYTSSLTIDHLFVFEVEVGIDKSIFNMPKEVVFVDTPGLKDPVKYRSNRTIAYIKNADAVLIALKPGPFTVEGLEIVTKVLDHTETDKAYIVGTQKDLNSEEERKKYVSNWVEHLYKAKRYNNKRSVMNRIILTSAKMEILIKKWLSLSEKEREKEECFSNDDFQDLSSYSAKILGKRCFNLLQISTDECDNVSKSTGVSALRNKLELSLIANYRKSKIEDIESEFIRCKNQITMLCHNAIERQQQSIELAMAGAEALKEQISSLATKKEILGQEGAELKSEAEKLENDIKKKIASFERKEN